MDRNVTLKRYSNDIWENIFAKTTIPQVTGLSTSLADMQADIDDKALKTNSIYYVIGNGTGTAGYWTGSIPDVTTLYVGLTIAYKIGINGSSITYLSINGGSDVIVRRNTGNMTTHLPIGTVVILVYDGTYWVWADYDGGTTYETYTSAKQLVGAQTITRYKFCIEGSDGKIYQLTDGDVTTTTKTILAVDLKIGGGIYWNRLGSSLSANAITQYYLSIAQNNTESARTYNATSGFTQGLPIYLVGIMQANGSFRLDNSSFTSFYTQTLPTTDDGKIYIYLGVVTETNGTTYLMPDHPIYQYKNGSLRLYQRDVFPTPAEIGALPSSSYNAADVLAKLVTVDGSGSGLDADLLDGIHASSFSQTIHTHGDVTSDGRVPTQRSMGNGDALVLSDNSDNSMIIKSDITLDTANTTHYLRRDGAWVIPPTGPLKIVKKLASNQSQTGPTLIDVTGMSYGLTSGKTYAIKVIGVFASNTATSGLKIYGHFTGNGIFHGQSMTTLGSLSSLSTAQHMGITSANTDWILSTDVVTVNSSNLFEINVIATISTSGTFKLQFAAEIGSGAIITLTQGMSMIIEELPVV